MITLLYLHYLFILIFTAGYGFVQLLFFPDWLMAYTGITFYWNGFQFIGVKDLWDLLINVCPFWSLLHFPLYCNSGCDSNHMF